MALGDKGKKTPPEKTDEAGKTDIKKGPEFTPEGEETTGDPGNTGEGEDVGDTDAADEAVETTVDDAADETDVVAAPEAGAITAPGKVTMAFANIENELPNMEFGILHRFHGSNGQMVDSDNNSIGKQVKLTLLSWRYTWMVTPGSNDAEADDFVKYSDDGKVLNDTQEPIGAYVASIKDQWPKTSIKKYVELTGILEESDGKEKEAYLGEMIQISLSPQSRKLFENYRMQVMVKIKMKRLDAMPETITLTAEPAQWDKNDYTKLVSS